MNNNNQLYLFVIYMLCGGLIGVGFDIFRILRKSFKTSDIVTYIEDALFGIVTGIFLIIMFFVFGNGQLRFYIFIAITLGMILYLFTISKYFIKISVKIILLIKRLIYIIIQPIKKIYKLITKPFYVLVINLKKLHIKKIGKMSNKKRILKKNVE